MTLVEQTITINGGRVSFRTTAIEPRSAADLANRHVAAVDLPGKQMEDVPDGIELAPQHESDGLLLVDGIALDQNPVRGLEPLLDGLHGALDVTQDVSSAVASDAVPAATPVPLTVEEPTRAGLPLERPVAGGVPAEFPPFPVGAPIPYFQDGTVTVYHGDCLELLDVWRDAAVLITDPPYGLQGLAGAYGTGHRTIANDADTRVRDAVLDIWGNRPAAVFGSPRLEEPPGGWSDRLVWDKGQLGLNGGAWRYAHESIFVRGDGWRRLNDASSSILRYTSQANRANVAKHIHSKPVPLVAQLVASAPPGLIVDPFGGGGATAVACATLGRPVIIIELELEHCETIVSRLQQQTFDFGVIE